MPSKSCRDCLIKLGFFKRKHRCRQCWEEFCDSCFSKVKLNRVALSTKLKNSNSNNCCLSCVVLSIEYFERELLFLLSTKQLSEYLISKHISISTCREKFHLVDLIMEFAEVNGFKNGSAIEHDFIHKFEIEELRRAELLRQVEERQTKFRNDTNFESNANEQDGSSTQNTSSMPHFSDTIPNASNSGVNTQTSSQLQDEPISDHQPSFSANTLSTEDEVDDVAATAMDVDEINATSQETLEKDETSSSNVKYNQSRGKWFSLENIKTESEIATLTVIELKQILKANFIDFRGCCEKLELIGKVRMLYKSEKTGNPTAGKSSDDDRDVCKICMDHLIDCVLLDCGHLVACTKCGKRLAECPVCRALVVRVAHIFRV